MKRILALILALLAVFALAACGGDAPDPNGGNTPDPPASQGILPNNDFTKLVPQPQSGKFIETGFAMDSMEIYTMEWTLEDAKAYVQLCKDAGFTNREFDTEDKHSYIWYAYNEEGRMVEVKWSDNESCYIKVQKY